MTREEATGAAILEASKGRPLFAFYLPDFHSHRHMEAFARRVNESMPRGEVLVVAPTGAMLIAIGTPDPDTMKLETWLRRVQWETLR